MRARLLFGMIIVGYIATALPARAAPPDNAEAHDQASDVEALQPKEDAERMICRNEKPIGSKRSVRVCRNSSAVEQNREEVRDTMQSRGSPPSKIGI